MYCFIANKINFSSSSYNTWVFLWFITSFVFYFFAYEANTECKLVTAKIYISCDTERILRRCKVNVNQKN